MKQAALTKEVLPPRLPPGPPGACSARDLVDAHEEEERLHAARGRALSLLLIVTLGATAAIQLLGALT